MGYLYPPGKGSIAAYSGGKAGFAENKRFGRKHKSGWCVRVWKEIKGERSGLGAYLSPMECGDNRLDYLITF